jgi:hypothetical protein
MAKVTRLHLSKRAPWTDIRKEFVRVQEIVSVTPRLRYQHAMGRKRLLVRGNMLLDYRPFKRQRGTLRASELRAYLKRCLLSTKLLSVEFVWPDNQEVNGKVLVHKMRSANASARAGAASATVAS